MTFPPGGPAPTPAKPAAATQELDKLLHMAAAGLSVLVLVAGFFSFAPEASAYAIGYGWIPALYLLAGGLSAQVLLPKPAKPGVLPGLVAVAVTLPLLFTVFTAGTTAWGAYVLLVFGVLTAVAAVGGYLVESGLVSPPAPKPYQAPPPQPGQWSPQTGGFPQPQPGQQPGGPFAGFGQQPTQAVPQPGQFGAPQQQSPQQQAPAPQPTQFMSHPGQFSAPVPPSTPGQGQPTQAVPQPGQQPGTPPSGFTAPPQS
ncbi:DUF5336 domain-containing protein [Kutzneria sp. NPDC052558]|uniref:DUF5336 domain-containing protein n=1 Tax=Kutzneria sp. NPDC052558 TaxID=3364121 RepID=UPI0037CCA731